MRSSEIPDDLIWKLVVGLLIGVALAFIRYIMALVANSVLPAYFFGLLFFSATFGNFAAGQQV